jgi:hypothetical protein
MQPVLLLSDIDDPHALAVKKHLVKKTEVFCLDTTTQIPIVTFKSEKNNTTATIDIPDQGVLDISKLGGILYRDYYEPVPPRSMDVKADAVFRSEHKDAFWGGLRIAENATWVNHPVWQKELLLKINQLNIANKLGLKIPNTIVTNNPESAFDFFKSHREVIVKLLSHEFYGSEPDDNLSVYTTLVDSNKFFAFYKDIANCPTLLQARVKKKCDIRINVVGDLVYAAAIESQELEESSVDFRGVGNLTKLKTYKHDLPDAIAHACIKMLKDFKLKFGAFDFALTPNNEYVFFEVNLTGNWLWLEEMANLNISEAIANLLLKKL